MSKPEGNEALPQEALEHAARILRVLGHVHRLRIIELIADQTLTVGEVALEVGIPPNACSQHLNMMKAFGVVDSERNGKTIHYRVVDPHALNVLSCIRKHTS